MNGIKIKQKQMACVERWVLHAVYIPKDIKRMLIETISCHIVFNGYVHYKFNDESIFYLSENCPIHFLQRDAQQLVISNISKQMIESHREQIRALEIERNIEVKKANTVNESMRIIKTYAKDIVIYEDDIKELENN